MRPGKPAICSGTVVHRRTQPSVHQFTYPIHQVWLDPDRPEALTGLHPLWSHSHPSPARFRRSDYGLASIDSLGAEVRSELEPVLGSKPSGQIRMITQIRRWGWLFNPITLFLAWDVDEENPVGAVLEVTNTPWKERHRYPLVLERDGSNYRSRFAKKLHVSPFLDEDFDYKFSMVDSESEAFYSIDVVDPTGDPIVETTARMTRDTATAKNMGRSLLRAPMSTRQVSTGIHAQAARLAAKRVPFVPHPKKREAL